MTDRGIAPQADLPIAPAQYSSAYLNQLLVTLRRLIGEKQGKDEETPRVILRSPNGTNYDVKVTDAGALVVTATPRAHV